jgi:hypothetical protein
MDRPPIAHVYDWKQAPVNDRETDVTKDGVDKGPSGRAWLRRQSLRHREQVEGWRTMDEQRRSPRYPADWAARYRLDARAAWRRCQLIDVSSDGAAIELHGVAHDEPLVGIFHLEIMSVTGSDDGIPVRGAIRHRSRTAMGRVLVGIEFEALTVEQLRMLELLVNLRAAV